MINGGMKPPITVDKTLELQCSFCATWSMWKDSIVGYNRTQCPECLTEYPYPYREMQHWIDGGYKTIYKVADE